LRGLYLTAFVLCAVPSTAQEGGSLRDMLERIERGEADGSHAAQLRVVNVGKEDIEKLTVLFPNGEVEFGDISVGVTTAYQEVLGGVYGYAAYRLELRGRIIVQPVIDWIGAAPMEGPRFSYRVEVNEAWSPTPVRLIAVTTDE
jgi:hypothetical protein